MGDENVDLSSPCNRILQSSSEVMGEMALGGSSSGTERNELIRANFIVGVHSQLQETCFEARNKGNHFEH